MSNETKQALAEASAAVDAYYEKNVKPIIDYNFSTAGKSFSDAVVALARDGVFGAIDLAKNPNFYSKATDIISKSWGQVSNSPMNQQAQVELVNQWRKAAIDHIGVENYLIKSGIPAEIVRQYGVEGCINRGYLGDNDLAITYVMEALQQHMMDTMAEHSAPRSSMEYIVKKSIDNSLVGSAKEILRTANTLLTPKSLGADDVIDGITNPLHGVLTLGKMAYGKMMDHFLEVTEEELIESEINSRAEAKYNPSDSEKLASKAIGSSIDLVTMGGANTVASLAKYGATEVGIYTMNGVIGEDACDFKDMKEWQKAFSLEVFGSSSVLNGWESNPVTEKAIKDGLKPQLETPKIGQFEMIRPKTAQQTFEDLMDKYNQNQEHNGLSL